MHVHHSQLSEQEANAYPIWGRFCGVSNNISSYLYDAELLGVFQWTLKKRMGGEGEGEGTIFADREGFACTDFSSPYLPLVFLDLSLFFPLLSFPLHSSK